MTFEYHPVSATAPTCKEEVEKPSRNATQSCAWVQGYVNVDLRADGLWKGWEFRVVTWNVDLLVEQVK